MKAQTSIDAYHDMGDDKRESERENVRLFILDNPDRSNEEIAQGVRLPISSVCGRCNELRHRGELWVNGRKKSPMGISVQKLRTPYCSVCERDVESEGEVGLHLFEYHCSACGKTFWVDVGEGYNKCRFLDKRDECL